MTQAAGNESATTATDAATTTDAATASDTAIDAGKQADIDWKAKSREWERKAKANSDAAARLALLEESQKTEAQKLADRAAQAEKERDEARLEAIRLEVAQSKGLTAGQARRLMGSTREELEADAAQFVADLKERARPSGSADQGPRGTAPTADPAQAFADFLHNQTRQ